MKPQTVLIVDDEPDIRRVVGEILRDEGLLIETAENADVAREKYRKHSPDLVLVDIWMPDTDGITLLKEWKAGENSPPVVMISGHGTVETAVESVRAGAYDFLEKPLSTAKLLVTVERALESRHLKDENLLLRNRLEPASTLTGRSPMIENLREQIGRIGPGDDSALITGEPGSGKGVVARALHRASPRSSAPFVEVRLSSIEPGSALLRLFGQENNDIIKTGFLEEANYGTLVLDEIDSLDLMAQTPLLNALNEKRFFRPGSHEPVSLDLRIIAITSKDLEEKVADGHFREDLYRYFSKVSIWVPPLRQHREDIPALVDYYARIIVDSERLPFRRFSTAAVNLIRNRNWSGNVRELREVIQRLLLAARTEEIDLEETRTLLSNIDEIDATLVLPSTATYEQPLRKAREQFERGYFIHHLEKAAGNMTELAHRSGMERTHLYRKLKSLGIDPKAVKEKRDNSSRQI
jgi:DNA-binding NtrC family response regulator